MSLSIRKNITRSRNGCAVCKSKRLKCDEAKPYCSRCERLGIPCPGYQKSLKWNTKPRPSLGQPNVSGARGSDSPLDTPGYAIDQSNGPQSTINLHNSEFSEQFANIMNTDDIQIQEYTCLESPLPFIDPLEGAQQFGIDTTPGPSSYLEYQGIHDDQPWPEGILSPVQQLELDPTPAPSSQLDHGELNEEEVWSNTLLNPAQPKSKVPDRQVSFRRFSASHRDMPLSRALQDHSSVLVEYYFKEVCGLMSCYDSRMNPYRTAISNVWSQSQPLYYIIQSMAAACLSEVSPNLSKISRQLRDAAVTSVSKETSVAQMETSSLLALVMLGMSLCWHDASSLGQSEFELLARTTRFSEAHGDNLSLADKQKKVFFYNSLIYWRMLLSFVTDQDLAFPAAPHPQPHPSQSRTTQTWELRMPHPQTGIGIEVQELVANVGSLIRRERKRIRSRRYSSRQDIEQSKSAIQAAEDLQVKLCAIDLPIESAIVDSGDEMTPTIHLLKIAEAYRCMGLLQLYRNFPDLLSLSSPSGDLPSQFGSPSNPEIDHDFTNTGILMDTWLTCLALHILDLVEAVPVSSRSRSIQPLLMVSVCSELSLSRSFCLSTSLQQVPVATITSSPRIKVPPTAMDVLQARRAIVSRLSFFENVLAAKPIRRMLLLIKETWACMDDKQQDVYWMDVMIERGYETLMG
ncbi:C6 zinc finger domain protein [Dactylonectria estremocensis]|uniref:C6 zinc finger domain protein n=1 Tax=Dactylonectria estremocensis TaxID=1079267 RepID=A0A9P9F2J8_9HYPO|nr:C6 zinc finger domain protein [Dactylonectria estremocensis]